MKIKIEKRYHNNLSGSAAANSGERDRKPIAKALCRPCSVVDVGCGRKNPPVDEQHSSTVPLLVAGDHPLELRRRAVELAVAEPSLHLQKLAERRRSGVTVAAKLPPLPPSLRCCRRRHDSPFLLFDCCGGPPCTAGDLGHGIWIPVL